MGAYKYIFYGIMAHMVGEWKINLLVHKCGLEW